MKLFINYRREDTDDLAGRLSDRMIAEFGSENIFRDVDSIRAGQNWKTVLEQSVAGCDIVLALIGKRWTSCADAKGKRRLTSDEDWVRFELETARRLGRSIMPVLVKGATVPPKEELPDSLHWLLDINVTEVRGDPFFKDDVGRLIGAVRDMRDRLAERSRMAQGSALVTPAVADSGGGILCLGCRRLCSRADQFCEGCGASLWEVCPKCHTPVPAGQRFCKSCGADVPKAKATEEFHTVARTKFNAIAAGKDGGDRCRQADVLLQEVDQAVRAAPEYAPLIGLRRQVMELACAAAGEAAAAEVAAKRLGSALGFYQRLAALGGETAETAARMNSIAQEREKRLGEATVLMEQGAYKQAGAILAPLLDAFSGDGTIRQKHDHCRKVIDRAGHLVSSRLPELKAQRRLVELEREFAWLEAQRVRIDKLPEAAAGVRKKLATAEVTIAKAHAALRDGNVKAAAALARGVLTEVADHKGALEIVQSSGGVSERIAQLEELVQLSQWSAAKLLVQELEDKKLADPRLAKLSAKVKAAVSEIDSSIILLGVVFGFVVAMGIFGVPFLASVITAPSGGQNFFYGVWALGSALLLSVTWLACGYKAQILRRLSSFILPRRRPGGAGPQRDGADQAAVDWATASEANIAVPAGLVIETGTVKSSTPSAPNDIPWATALEPPEQGVNSDTDQKAGEVLSPNEHIERVESTAMVVEWLALGAIVTWLTHAVALKLIGQAVATKIPWWNIPLIFCAQALGLFLVACWVGGLAKCRRYLVILAGYGALLLGIGLAAPTSLPQTICCFCVHVVYIGALLGVVYRLPWWRGACTSLGGTLGALAASSPIILMVMVVTFLAFPKFPLLTTAATEHSKAISPVFPVLPITAAAVIWCMNIVAASTASETLVRGVVMNRSVLRGLGALSLASATAAVIYLLVVLGAALLNEKWLKVMCWVVFFAVAQPAPPFLRWRWRAGVSLYSAALCLIMIGLIAFMDWLSPESTGLAASLIFVSSAVILLNVKTMDMFANKAEILMRLRTRLFSSRLPVRIEVSRRIG